MPSTSALATDLRLVSRIENWQRFILLNLAGSGQLDAHLSHAIVSHAENASIRTALIEACLDRLDAGRGTPKADAGQMPFSVSRLLSMGRTTPIPLMLEMARLRQAFYRRLRMLAHRAHEARIATVCDEIYRMESDFARTLRAWLSATTPHRITISPRAASPLDALLARHASGAASAAPPDLQITPPQRSNRAQ